MGRCLSAEPQCRTHELTNQNVPSLGLQIAGPEAVLWRERSHPEWKKPLGGVHSRLS